MPPDDLERLGADYRTAKASIAVHRQRQAAAEIALHRLAARLGPDHPAVADARQRVDQAAADVRWCVALVVACGEAYKGCALADVPNGRTAATAGRQRALDALTGNGGN